MLHEVNIAGLTLDPESNAPIIILKTLDEEETIPIWIGLLEATSIASALQDIKFDRPMTHDLFKNFMDHVNYTVTKVEVSDLRDNTFYGRIHFDSPGGIFDMDARPSDAIAIAIRYKAPIFVDEKVISQSKDAPDGGVAADNSEEGQKYADYLNNLSSEDFGKYKV